MDLIIPVFNRLEYTQVCLEAVAKVNHGLRLRPIVVNNGSRRRTAEYINSWAASAPDGIDKPLVITLPENMGYAVAVNEAIKVSPEGEHVIIMHNDCVPFDGWASELVDALRENEKDDAIVTVPRTSYANEVGPCVTDVRKSFEVMKPSNKQAITSDDVKALISRLYPDQGQLLEELRRSPRTNYLSEISSFCMAVSKPLLVENPMDPEFWPRFFEDKFWFLPYERQGCVCMVSNWSYVHHFGNITTDGPGFTMPDLFAMNEERFKEKVRLMTKPPARKESQDGSL